MSYLSGYGFSTITDLGNLLFKWEQEGGEDTKPLNSSYDVVGLVDGGKEGATLDYVSGDIFDTSNPVWLVVKGGNSGFVVYDLDTAGSLGVEWDGVEDLVFTNAGLLGPNGQLQGISNIQIWGGSKTPTSPGPVPANGVVPEPTTLAIWSVLGIGGLVSRRRNRSTRS